MITGEINLGKIYYNCLVDKKDSAKIMFQFFVVIQDFQEEFQQKRLRVFFLREWART